MSWPCALPGCGFTFETLSLMPAFTYRAVVEPRDPERDARKAAAMRDALAKIEADEVAARDRERKARQAAAMREALENIEAEEAAKAARTARSRQMPVPPSKPKSVAPPTETPAGWYPHPTMAGTQRYWDGASWTDNIAPVHPPDSTPPGQSQILIAALLAGAVVGLIVALQSASLLTGTGTIWTGVAIACGASCVTWVVKGLPTWVRVICVGAALVSVVNAVSVEAQLEDKRQEIAEILP